jgi:hypothetical protein
LDNLDWFAFNIGCGDETETCVTTVKGITAVVTCDKQLPRWNRHRTKRFKRLETERPFSDVFNIAFLRVASFVRSRAPEEQGNDQERREHHPTNDSEPR